MEDKQIVNVPGGKNIEIVIRVFDNPSAAPVVNDDPQLNDKLKEAEERARAVEDENKSLQSQLSTVEGEKNSLQSRLSTVEGEKFSLQSRLSTVEGEKLSLQSKLSTVEGEKFSLQSQLKAEKEKARTLEGEKNSLQRKFEPVRRLVEVHEQYINLPPTLRADFYGLIFDQNPVTFAMSLASVERLKRFYSKIGSVVANSTDEIESDMAFPDRLKTLAAVFDFFFENNIEGNCTRQNVAVGAAFNETNCYRVGRRSGKVKEVLIQGFAVEGKAAAQSIVLVEDF